MEKQKRHMRRLRKKYRTYLIPVLVSLTLCLVVILLTLNLVRQETNRNIDATCAYFRESIDNEIVNYVYSSHELLNCAQVQNLQEALHSGDAEAIHRKAVLLQSHINAFRTINPLVNDVIFYFPDADILVCRYGKLTPKQYFSLKVQSGAFDMKALNDWFLSCFDRGWNGSFPMGISDESCDFYFFRSDPDNRGMAYYDCGMLIEFNHKTIISNMEELIDLTDQDSVSMVTGDGTVYAYAGTNPEVLRRSGSIVRTVHSDMWNMDINFVKSTTDTERFLGTLGILIGLGFLGALVVNFLPLLFIQRKIRTQSKQALDRIGHKSSQAEPFEAVTTQLNELYEQNLERIQTINRQQRLLGGTCLRDLLYNRDRASQQMEALCFTYGISLENEAYTPFLYTPKQDEAAAENVIYEILNLTDSPASTVLMAPLEDCFIFLCNYEDSGRGAQALADLYIKLEALPGELYGKGSNFDNLADAIDEARTIYRVAFGRSLLENANESSSAQAQQMILLLRNHSYATALELLPNLDTHVPCDHNDSAALCLRYTFLSQLYQLPQFKEDASVPNAMFSCLADAEWMEPLQEFLKLNADKDKAATKSLSAVEQAELIIRTEYTDHSLSLSSLAVRLDISASYLSRSFKNAYGENISHYLQKVRVEKAKELMLRENLALNTVALRVGFLNDVSFIRTFKLLEDETPGSYRRRVASSDYDDGEEEL